MVRLILSLEQDDLSNCNCPAGKRLYRSGSNCNRQGVRSVGFKGTQSACDSGKLQARCLRKPYKTLVRQDALFLGKHESAPERPIGRMRRNLDTEAGFQAIARRVATVEPMFANLWHTKGLDRVTLRSRKKVEAQWRLYRLVHHREADEGDSVEMRGGMETPIAICTRTVVEIERDGYQRRRERGRRMIDTVWPRKRLFLQPR